MEFTNIPFKGGVAILLVASSYRKTGLSLDGHMSLVGHDFLCSFKFYLLTKMVCAYKKISMHITYDSWSIKDASLLYLCKLKHKVFCY